MESYELSSRLYKTISFNEQGEEFMKLTIVQKMFTLVAGLLLSMNVMAAGTLSDTAITAKVKAGIAAEPNLSVFKVGVETNNGVVMLSGKVDSAAQASDLVSVAQSVDGVKDVNTSQLTIKNSPNLLDDAVITAKVKGKFIQEKLFKDKKVAVITVSVETTNGVVHLSGTVDNQAEANNAVTIAKSVKGVKSVKSTIKVQPSANK